MSSTEKLEPRGNRSSDHLDNQAAANRALPEPKLGQVSHNVVENWWAAPISNRLSVAFHAGRLLNQLNWHLQNTLFFVSLGDDKMVAEVLNRLAAVSSRLSTKSDNHLEEAIIDVRESADADGTCLAVYQSSVIGRIKDHSFRLEQGQRAVMVESNHTCQALARLLTLCDRCYDQRRES